MTSEEIEDISLADQIVSTVLDKLAQNDAFDAGTIERLRELAISGNLSDYRQVVSALSVRLRE